MKNQLSIIILTHNEQQNLEGCLRAIGELCERIFIVDSFSTDSTLSVAQRFGAEIVQHPFRNQADQFNWALNNLPIKSEWVMRLDADEQITPELRDELIHVLPQLSRDVTGLYVKRRVHFMGRWIRNGGYYPTWLLRIWRNGKGRCEERWMDEHVRLSEGKTRLLEHDIIDDNKKNLHWWIEKHNLYATREAVDILNLKYAFMKYEGIPSRLFGTQEQRKRWMKLRYAELPLVLRPFLYFMYRYFLKLGFLDGKEGLIWHFLQGFWYRFLVDAKIFEIYKRTGRDREGIRTFIKEEYGIDLND